jgi:hypothetical protein
MVNKLEQQLSVEEEARAFATWSSEETFDDGGP